MQAMSNFYCTSCGREGIPIFRKKDALREDGHLKKLYCIYCKSEQNFAEIKEKGKYSKNDFFLEFKYGNFENGIRKIPYRQFVREIKKFKEEKEEL